MAEDGGRGWGLMGGGNRGGGGGDSWKSDGLEFDTKGVREFTTEIGKAEKAVKSFVGHFKELDKILSGMDEGKIKALGGIGKGITGGNGGDVSFTSAHVPKSDASRNNTSGDSVPSGSEQTPERGHNTNSFGGGGVAGAYFAGELIQRAGSRIGASLTETRQIHGAIDYANVLGTMRTGRSMGAFDRAADWRDLQGVTDRGDAASMMTRARMHWGAGLGTSGMNARMGQFSRLNMVNPGFGSATAAFTDYESAFTSPQAQWSMIQQGLAPAVQGGELRDPSKVFQDMILRATGKKSFADLSRKEALQSFGYGGQARQNLGVIMPGMSAEMTDAISTLASSAAGGRGIDAAMNTSAVRNSIIGKEFEGTAQKAMSDAVQTRKGRDSTMNVIEAENWLAVETDKVKNAFGGLIPIITALGDKMAGIVGAGATAGSLLSGGLANTATTALGYGLGRKIFGAAGKGVGGAAGAARGGAGVASRFLGRALGGPGAVAATAIYGANKMHDAGVFGNTIDSLDRIGNKIRGDENWNLGAGVDRVARGFRNLDDTAKDFIPFWGDPVEGVGHPGDRYSDVGDPGDSARIPGDLDPGFSGRIKSLVDAAPFDITVSSGRRSTKRQEEIFLSRHRVVSAGTPGAKYYKGKYYQRIPGTAAVAVPGTSKHEKGHAVDLRIDGISANSHRGWQQWIGSNASKFGLRHGASFGEWWHIETPGTVSENGGSGADSATPTPRLAGVGSGGGSGGGYARHRFFDREQSISTILAQGSKAPGFEHAAGGGGAFPAESVAGSGGGGSPFGGSDGMIGVLRRAGFSGEGLRIAYAVMMGESQGNPNAFNGNRSTGDESYGLFQINMLGRMGPDRRKQFGLATNRDLFDPNKNAEVAFKMSGGGQNWQPWSAYKNGSYKKYYRDDIGDPTGGGDGGGNTVTIQGGGGQSISIGNVSLAVHTTGVSEAEAARLAHMVIRKIEEEAQMKTLGGA